MSSTVYDSWASSSSLVNFSSRHRRQSSIDGLLLEGLQLARLTDIAQRATFWTRDSLTPLDFRRKHGTETMVEVTDKV